jgi:hypothetical protein
MTVVFVAAMATACVGDPDLATSTSTQGLVDGNSIVGNRIVLNRIVLNRIVLNRIVLNQISSDTYLMVSNELIATDEGRELLSYVVSCAIPHGVMLLAEHGGETYEFPGQIGLAPKWLRRSLHESEQRWVSACLIARVNRFGIPVSISIRGPHDALKVSAAEANDYSVEEAAFYGNVFTPLHEPLIWNACRGRDEAADESGDLDLRDCSEPDPENPGLTLCGFTYAGDCADWGPPRNAYACKKFKEPRSHQFGVDLDLGRPDHRGGYYEQCHDSPGLGRWHHAERFDEVVTVFLAPQ